MGWLELPFILQSLTCRSSAPETMRGRVGWKAAQLTPLSWPSRTCLTTVSDTPNRSVWPEGLIRSSIPPGPGDTFFFLNPVEDLYELLMAKGKGKEHSKRKQKRKETRVGTITQHAQPLSTLLSEAFADVCNTSPLTYILNITGV